MRGSFVDLGPSKWYWNIQHPYPSDDQANLLSKHQTPLNEAFVEQYIRLHPLRTREAFQICRSER